MTDDGNNGAVAEGRGPKGRFAAGNPGRPVGTRHKITRAAEALLDGETEALTRKAIDLAKEGDTAALRLCLERILPPVKSRTIRLEEFPDVETVADVSAALRELIAAVAAGDISPVEAADVAGLLEVKRRSLDALQIEERLKKIEEALGKGSR